MKITKEQFSEMLKKIRKQIKKGEYPFNRKK